MHRDETDQVPSTTESEALGGKSLADAMAEAAEPSVAALLGDGVELKAFRSEGRPLSLEDRKAIVDQALVLVELNYVHLPHKAAMHAVNPVQRLRLLRSRLDNTNRRDLPPVSEFHAEMSEIFHSMRDLHTNYLLPEPYASRVAFLPFLVEEYFTDKVAQYMVTKVVRGADLAGLAPGALITHWNGTPIERAVEVNAARYAGSNAAARHTRGVESLTVRPLRIHRFPDEDWVVVRFIAGGVVKEVLLPWLVATNLPSMVSGSDTADTLTTALGLDLDMDDAQRARKLLFAQEAAAAELDGRLMDASAQEVPSTMPGVFRAARREVNGVTYGHLRIFTFNVSDPGAFLAEFVRLCEALPSAGMIVDVRGNGGGHIYAAEMALQVLTPTRIAPEPAQFTTTALNRDLCRQHPDDGGAIDLGPWLPSMEQSVETGAPYSTAHPITPPALANAVGQRYYGPVVLITDARCYSATDIFSAGFADHRIGAVLGVDANTGAGGANVWTHGLLNQLLRTTGSVRSPYRTLPGGVDMRVAIRRTLRVGPTAGTPVEDLGVVPDERHWMTRRDVESQNEDLIAHAVRLLAAQPARDLSTSGTVGADGTLSLIVTTAGVDRLDVWLDERPAASVDVTEHETRVEVPVTGARRLRVDGYAGGRLVVGRRDVIGPVHDGVGLQPDATLVTSPASHVPLRLSFLITAGSADRATVARQVRKAFGRGWVVAPLFDSADKEAGTQPPPELHGYFTATGTLTREDGDDARRAEAFQMSRALMAQTGYDVQPDLPSGSMYPTRGRVDDAGGLFGDEKPLPGTDDRLWALKNLRVPQAWAATGQRGQGILIAQPDTGVTAHSELSGGIDTARDRDLLDNDADATDPLTRRWWWLDNPGHGTSTSSVVISRDQGLVTGSAPEATLVPLRSIRSVVLVFDGDVARAVEHARQAGCHVITMSLGGVGFSPALRAAIQAAIRDGVIVMAAAGNQVGFVVSPANYPEVIAVAGSNIQDRPWRGSSHGTAVDITAPAESLHVARAAKGMGGANTYDTGPGSGTSFAVALTAGVAALWLRHHGRDTLIARYGKANLQAVFADALRRSARRPSGWDTGQYGPGIVDAQSLLARALPTAVPPLAAGAGLTDAASLDAAERLSVYLPDQSSATAAAALEALVGGTADRDLYAGELAYFMSQDPTIAASVAATGLGGSVDGEQFSTLQRRFAVQRLRRVASPALARDLAQPV